MRREERQIQDRDKLFGILEQAHVCRIAFNDNPFPYVVPVNFVYVEERLYFHSALAGRKMDLIAKDGLVCFEIDRQIVIRPDDIPCGWGVKYESVIGEGKAFVLADLNEKRSALLCLMEKYSGRSDWEFSSEVLQSVAVVRVDIHSITGKASS